MGRLTRDPELRRTGSPEPPVTSLLPGRRPGLQVPDRREGDGFHRRGRLASAPRSLSASTSPRAAWPWWRAGCRSATGTDRDGNKRRSAEVVADNVYFGDSKRDGAPRATMPRPAADAAAMAALRSTARPLAAIPPPWPLPRVTLPRSTRRTATCRSDVPRHNHSI